MIGSLVEMDVRFGAAAWNSRPAKSGLREVRDTQSVNTVRFTKVVEKSGAPEMYLVLTDPSKDRTLQAAVKGHRVMTVAQETVGNKTDRGEIGFHPGPGRQFLVFPKSLHAFVDHNVVGIKYDLVSSSDVPKNKRAAPPLPPKKPEAQPKPATKIGPKKNEPAAARKVVAFKPVVKDDEDVADEDEDIAELKKQVRHAMAVLEEGKAVAAFNLLKRIVGD